MCCTWFSICITPVKWMETYFFLIALTFVRSFVRVLFYIIVSILYYCPRWTMCLVFIICYYIVYSRERWYAVVGEEFGFVLSCSCCSRKRLDLMFSCKYAIILWGFFQAFFHSLKFEIFWSSQCSSWSRIVLWHVWLVFHHTLMPAVLKEIKQIISFICP